MRALWMAHELGLDFDHQPGLGMETGPSEALLAANPMGQVPAIDDDGFALSESMAINLYLAKKHGKLAPATLEAEAQTLRWCFWAMTAVEKTMLDVLLDSRGLMGAAEGRSSGQGWHRSVAAAIQGAERRAGGARLPGGQRVQRRRPERLQRLRLGPGRWPRFRRSAEHRQLARPLLGKGSRRQSQGLTASRKTQKVLDRAQTRHKVMVVRRGVMRGTDNPLGISPATAPRGSFGNPR